MIELDRELFELKEKIMRKNKVEAMLESLKAELDQLKKERDKLRKCAEKEQADVDRLERLSLTSLLYAAINKKTEKLDKEKAEAYAAAVKLRSKEMQIENAERYAQTLKAELETLSDVEARYNEAFAKKSEVLKTARPELASKITYIEERLGSIAAQEREVQEALDAGNEALALIPSIEYELGSARSLATFDLFSRSILADLAKHSHLDKCQSLIYELQMLLNRYRTELADIQIQAELRVQIDGFLRFADFFFDGLFADITVLDKIEQSQKQVGDIRCSIENMQIRLNSIKDSFGNEAKRLSLQLEEIVSKA